MDPVQRRAVAAGPSRLLAPLLAVLLAAAPVLPQPVGTAFTYQGRLTDGGNPANGAYDLQLALFDAGSGGAQVGPTLTRDDVLVASGLFTVTLDFGSVFAGSRRWLEVRVRPGASTGAYTSLAGRQELTASPNALFSSTVPWAGVSGKPAGFADDVDNDSGGDITGVTAGAGLSGGGSTGSVSLAVSFGGSGAATSASRSDHDHLGAIWSGSFGLASAFRVINTGSGGFADGIWGQADAPGSGRGVVGYATNVNGTNFGVWGQADSTSGRGVFGVALSATGSNRGVHGQSASATGTGVFGEATAGSGLNYGVSGESASSNGRAVYGNATAANGTTYGVYGQTAAAVGIGTYGVATATFGANYGVLGETNSSAGYGVFGLNSSGAAAPSYGVYGQSMNGADGRGVGGRGVYGFWGTGTTAGVYGIDQNPAANSVGVWGQSVSTAAGAGVFAQALGTTGGFGIYAQSFAPTTGWAGYFVGRVNVTGTLSKGGGSFKIDHPLDPEHKYLYHSFVESPDMKNIYDGNVVTDAEGFATVDLPEWFEALNRDFRYQLTVIGRFAQAIVAREIEDNRFTIQTSVPHTKVSWQVTGIRHDAFAETYRIPVEEDKPDVEDGTYLYPEAFGLPRERGVESRQSPALRLGPPPSSRQEH